jgi:hypothetical protein
MADATLRDLTAATDIAATDVLVIQNTDSDGAYYKITGTNFAGALESGGGIALSLAAAQAAATSTDKYIQYNNGGARGGDVNLQWDNSGKALVIGEIAVGNTTQVKLPQQADVNTPTLAFGDGDTGIYEQSDDVIRFAVGASGSMIVGGGSAYMYGSGAYRGGLMNEAASSTNPTLVPDRGDDNTGVGLAAADKLSLVAGGAEIVRASESTQDALMFKVSDFPSANRAEGALRPGNQDFQNGCLIWVDESANKLYFSVRYSSNAYKSGTVNLS